MRGLVLLLTTRIYDCSNSSERPAHRSVSKGPSENDIMRGLKKYAHVFGFEYIDNPEDAEVIITNDVYPSNVLVLDKPRVKRMDGVFFLEHLKERNEPLNQAALQSTIIVFISEYSQYSFIALYGKGTDDSFVIPNCVDESVFFPLPKKIGNPYWMASASNWAREEKRYEDLMVFARDVMSHGEQLMVIGECDEEYVPNVVKVGYIDDEREMNRVINMGKAFINLSYRDPAPKVVCQAVNCKLPILYANSGGTPEMVNAGVAIKDESKMNFEGSVPRLKLGDMRTAYDEYWDRMKELRMEAQSKDTSYMEMLGTYFWVCRDAILEYGRRKEMK